MAGKGRVDRVMVSGYEYEVEEDIKLLESNRAGEIQLLHGKILIAPELSPSMFLVTLLHEMQHGNLWHAGEKEHDERHIDIFSNSLIPMHRDNPKLTEMILACATRQPKRNPTRK